MQLSPQSSESFCHISLNFNAEILTGSPLAGASSKGEVGENKLF